jgi:hypothetical protein
MPPPRGQGEQFVARVKAKILTAKTLGIWNRKTETQKFLNSIPQSLFSSLNA